MMHLSSGIPTRDDLARLLGSAQYRRHTDYARDFLARHNDALAGYGKHWGADPFGLWSRRWEYPYAIESVLAYAERRGTSGPLKLLDAGSGVTFFPYLVCDRVPDASAVCVDSDATYPPMFAAINKQQGHDRVQFVQASLQAMPVEAASVDVVACISVLEHTDRYDDILAEFARVLKPGGLLVLTFDLSLDGKFTLSRPQAQRLLAKVAELFDADEAKLLNQLSAMDEPDAILTTQFVKQTNPELLPWRWPWIKGVHDLLHGHGWTGGFRSKSVFCLNATARSRNDAGTPGRAGQTSAGGQAGAFRAGSEAGAAGHGAAQVGATGRAPGSS
ncbi:MAG: class I SAM-dependent methyltransferase [Phycisphaerae bacterium]